jgi:hypothetical protein
MSSKMVVTGFPKSGRNQFREGKPVDSLSNKSFILMYNFYVASFI